MEQPTKRQYQERIIGTRTFTLKDLIINGESPREVYRQRTHENKRAVHWGQRKLLLSEIEFFVLHWR